MANEWNFCSCKSANVTADEAPTPIWDALFHTLAAADPYGRQMSIHNGNLLYNHSQPWITHVSLQGHEGDTPALRARYAKPMVWDEVRYEGNLSSSWGALSGPEMADRFFLGASLGVHVGHSETITRAGVSDDQQPLWWAKGGTLIGSSPARIKWFRALWPAADGGASSNPPRPPFGSLVPTRSYLDDASKSAVVVNLLSAPNGTYSLLHFNRAGQWTVPLSHAAAAASGGRWEVRELDYWAMTVRVLAHLPADASSTVLDVPTIPSNFEIVLCPT